MKGKERREEYKRFGRGFDLVNKESSYLFGILNNLQGIASYVGDEELEGYADILKEKMTDFRAKCQQFESRISIVTERKQDD